MGDPQRLLFHPCGTQKTVAIAPLEKLHMNVETQNQNIKKKKDGPPFLENPRRFTVSAKLNKDELDFVLTRIRATGLTRSEAFRLLLLHEELPSVVHKGVDVSASAAYQNLQPLQSNINQIARILNSDRTSQLDLDGVNKIVQFVRKVEGEVKTLRQEIIGATGD